MSSILIVLVMVPYKEIMFLAKACDAVFNCSLCKDI